MKIIKIKTTVKVLMIITLMTIYKITNKKIGLCSPELEILLNRKDDKSESI